MTKIFAHRGLHVEVPENTVAAFAEAKLVGADGVELDVRRTADGALVIHHDAVIEGAGDIGQLKLSELPVGVATLNDAMSACAGIAVNVEIKNDPSEAAYDASGSLAAQVVSALIEGGWRDDVIISSFDLATCEAVRAVDSDIQIGWLLDWRRGAAGDLAVAQQRGLNAIHPFFQRTDQALVQAAHEGGIAVNVWTVNFLEEMNRLLDLDVDTLITDDPVSALAAVSARAHLA